MTTRHIQPTFAGGEFAPSLYARVDVAKYGTGLKTARNFIVHPHGGVSNRAGTKFIHEVKDSSKATRLIPFEFSTEQAYMIEFGDYYCRFYKDGGIILVDTLPEVYVAETAYEVNDYVRALDGGTTVWIYRCIQAGTGHEPFASTDYWLPMFPYVVGMEIPFEISTPYAASGLQYLRYAQSADVLYLVHPTVTPQQLIRYDHDDWTIGAMNIVDGPFMPQNASATTIAVSALSGTSKTATASTSIFTQNHVGSLWQISHDMPADAVSGSHTADATSSSIGCQGGWRLFATGTTFEGSVRIEYSTDAGVTWNLLRRYTNVGTLSASGTESDYIWLRYVVTRTAGTLVVDLNSDPHTRNGVIKITAVASGTSATVDILSHIASTDATPDWSEGSWSDENGYPSAIGFYQDRLCFSRTYAEPQLLWASVTGDYSSFARSIPLEDTDGISVSLPSYKVNGIEALVPLGDIVVLTSSAEWSVGPTSDGVFTPTSILTNCQGYRGSASVQPVVIGNRIIYVQPSGATVRDLAYDAGSDGYVGDNLSIFSNHLFTGYTIVEMAYQQDPDSIVWFVRSDGKLVALTYLREQEVIAWTWHDTDGLVESISCIPADGYDEVWLVVNRTIGGATKRYIECMARRTISTLSEDQYYVDCGLSYSGAATTTITGLDHLEGETVSVLADGNVVEDLVVTSGSITLPVAAAKVHVGLPYVSDFETLNLELPNAKETLQGRQVQVPELTIRFLNSRGGYVGPDSSNLLEIVQRAGEPLGSAILLYSGDYKTAIDTTFDNGGRIFIRQTDPLPMTILAIMPTVNF